MLDGWNACIATDASGDPLYQLKVTGKGTKESMIVILKQSIALRYPGVTLKTFCHNNILLSDTKMLPLMWSLDSLKEIGNIDLVREVQGFCFLPSSRMLSDELYFFRPSMAQLWADKGANSCQCILTWNVWRRFVGGRSYLKCSLSTLQHFSQWPPSTM